MNYTPEHQYRCTIIRGKSQSDMEDLLPLYANMVHRTCPCEENEFKTSCRAILSKALFNSNAYELLPPSNQKTVNNHLTEIAGVLLGLYYPEVEGGKNIIFESEACRNLLENNDFPLFFKNLCLNFQFPNGAKKITYVTEDIKNNLNIRPFCYVVSLLKYAQDQPEKVKLQKQEIGYYVLNNLDVLQGNVDPSVVYNRIIYDRQHHIKREKLSGSRDWQHIKEQFNLLELSNIIRTDATYIWLNNQEERAISLFVNKGWHIGFNSYEYPLDSIEETNVYFDEWKKYYGTFNSELYGFKTEFAPIIQTVDDSQLKENGGAIKSTVDLGDDGEALIFKLEQERIKKYKPRLVNKVLLLGKTKGLGYDISSIEADENPSKPEFARYIEVKSTKRITEPKFDSAWTDSLNITAKEWVAAEQYKEYYNIYRVYFTKSGTIIRRIKNPFDKAKENKLEVYPIIYQMNFGSTVIDNPYK